MNRKLATVAAAVVTVLAAPAALAQTPAEKPQPAATAKPDVDAPGIMFDARTGASAIAGSYVKGIDAKPALGTVVGARFGAYANRHVGLVVGLELGTGAVDSCDECSAMFVRAPMAIEVAVLSPKRGPYFDVGATIFSRYRLTGGTTVDLTLTGEMPEGHFGFGWRLPFVSKATGRSFAGLDLFMAADGGVFTHIYGADGRQHQDGQIVDEARTFHVALSLGVAMHFTP